MLILKIRRAWHQYLLRCSESAAKACAHEAAAFMADAMKQETKIEEINRKIMRAYIF
jgi:hypothetical protein